MPVSYTHLVPFALEPCTTTLTRHVNPLPFVPEDGAECSEHCDEIILLAALGLKKRMEHSGAQAAVDVYKRQSRGCPA